MIYTSYFSKSANQPNAISIAGKAPQFYKGPEYKKLAPKFDWWIKWKNEKLSNDWFVERYYITVLSKLNPQEVAKELDGKILLCWESPEKFCHRHLVAEWLRMNGIEVKEL